MVAGLQILPGFPGLSSELAHWAGLRGQEASCSPTGSTSAVLTCSRLGAGVKPGVSDWACSLPAKYGVPETICPALGGRFSLGMGPALPRGRAWPPWTPEGLCDAPGEAGRSPGWGPRHLPRLIYSERDLPPPPPHQGQHLGKVFSPCHASSSKPPLWVLVISLWTVTVFSTVCEVCIGAPWRNVAGRVTACYIT